MIRSSNLWKNFSEKNILELFYLKCQGKFIFLKGEISIFLKYVM